VTVRYALISDLHANLPAVTAVLADIRGRHGVDAVHHLGDLVGYAPWPDEVVELIAAERIAGVAGNYDSTIATDYDHCGCRAETPEQEELAHQSYQWTRARVSAGTRSRLAALPFRMDLRPLGGHTSHPTVTLLHGDHVLNTVYADAGRPESFLRRIGEALRAKPGDAVCVGHTHKAWHRVVDEVHYVNTGSVGRPKDGDPRAGYVVLTVDVTGVDVEFVRVRYDVEAAAREIEASSLPHEFGAFLRTGGAM
jgi:predicted phosphodiesterase